MSILRIRRAHASAWHGARFGILGAAMAACFASVAAAQSPEVPAPPQQAVVAVRHATVHTCVPGAAPIADGYVVFDRGRIVAVGAEPMPAGLVGDSAHVVDAPGHVLTPGLWAGATALGLVETLQVAATDDRTEFGDFHPEVRAAVAVNPDSDLPPVARNAGILMAHAFPEGGTVSGHASAMRLDGWTAKDRCVREAAGLVLRWPMMEPVRSPWTKATPEEQRKERDRALASIDRFFDAAEAYVRARDADPSIAQDMRFESMRAALRGEEPVLVDANWPGQIESAVLWGVRRGYRITIVGGLGAPEVAPLLVAHRVPVVVNGINRLPLREGDGFDAAYTVPARLHAAGVECSIASGDEPAHERSLPGQCGRAVAYGLPHASALEAVTRNAARIAGCGDTHGTVEAGKSATLVLWTADPFEVTTTVRRAWVDGGEVDLGDRQKRMRAKYREKEIQREPAPAAPDEPAPTAP
jgi:imidazolonepropionase-like amidohydrolase